MPWFLVKDKIGGVNFWEFGSTPEEVARRIGGNVDVGKTPYDFPRVLNDQGNPTGDRHSSYNEKITRDAEVKALVWEAANPDTGTGEGMEGAAEGDYLELAAPEAAFRKYLRGLNLSPQYYAPPAAEGAAAAPVYARPTLRQQAAQAQYEPLSALFTGQQLLGTEDPREEDEVVRERMFRSFLEGLGTQEGVMPRATPGDLRSTFTGFETKGGLGSTGPIWQQMATRPQTVTEGRPLANLGLQALRSTISPLALRYFNLPSQEELATRYLSGPTAGVQNYAKFLRAQLGIPA
jgi:hypothetical protein